MSYKVKSDQSAQLMYIKDTNEYKIVVDVGDVIYVFDTPANSTIYQLTDLQEVAGQSEQQVRASAGIYVTDNDTFMSGFFNDDRLVSVAIDVNQITPAIADDAQDILKTFFDDLDEKPMEKAKALVEANKGKFRSLRIEKRITPML